MTNIFGHGYNISIQIRFLKEIKVFSVKIARGEKWYGGDIMLGSFMPVGSLRPHLIKGKRVVTANQFNTLLVSDKGRYIWTREGADVLFLFGRINVMCDKDNVTFKDGLGNLKGAYETACKNHFPFRKQMPAEIMFRAPQYCTWIEMTNRPSAEKVIAYARSIIESGMPAGELIIDDGWQRNFGEWEFTDKFPDPAGMVKTLNGLGFKVILWICPFISEKSPDFSYLKEKGLLVKNKNGEVAFRNWWNGRDALLDHSNPEGLAWYRTVTENLKNKYNVDGFKMDAGDARFYRDDDINFAGANSNEMSRLWALAGTDNPFSELRACFQLGGYGLAQRLADKNHSWGKLAGLRSLIPNALLAGVSGYPFVCPDMIGGGQVKSIEGGTGGYDNELFKRSCECSSLMPMMQFSIALWNMPDKSVAQAALLAAKRHSEFSDYIVSLAEEAAVSGRPIIRYCEYEFPGQKMYRYKQQFMLGDKYLIAPVTDKKGYSAVKLPKGRWKNLSDGSTVEGGKLKVSAFTVYERI